MAKASEIHVGESYTCKVSGVPREVLVTREDHGHRLSKARYWFVSRRGRELPKSRSARSLQVLSSSPSAAKDAAGVNKALGTSGIKCVACGRREHGGLRVSPLTKRTGYWCDPCFAVQDREATRRDYPTPLTKTEKDDTAKKQAAYPTTAPAGPGKPHQTTIQRTEAEWVKGAEVAGAFKCTGLETWDEVLTHVDAAGRDNACAVERLKAATDLLDGLDPAPSVELLDGLTDEQRVILAAGVEEEAPDAEVTGPAALVAARMLLDQTDCALSGTGDHLEPGTQSWEDMAKDWVDEAEEHGQVQAQAAAESLHDDLAILIRSAIGAGVCPLDLRAWCSPAVGELVREIDLSRCTPDPRVADVFPGLTATAEAAPAPPPAAPREWKPAFPKLVAPALVAPGVVQLPHKPAKRRPRISAAALARARAILGA